MTNLVVKPEEKLHCYFYPARQGPMQTVADLQKYWRNEKPLVDTAISFLSSGLWIKSSSKEGDIIFFAMVNEDGTSPGLRKKGDSWERISLAPTTVLDRSICVAQVQKESRY